MELPSSDMATAAMERLKGGRGVPMYSKAIILKVDRYLTPMVREQKGNPNAALLSAASAGSAAEVRDAMKRGAELNVRDVKGRTPLFLAALYRNTNAMEALFSYGFLLDKHATDKGGYMPVHAAAMRGTDRSHAQANDPAAMQMMSDFGMDVNKPTAAGDTPVMMACWFGLDAVVALLVKQAPVFLPLPMMRGHSGLTAEEIAHTRGYPAIEHAVHEAGKPKATPKDPVLALPPSMARGVGPCNGAHPRIGHDPVYHTSTSIAAEIRTRDANLRDEARDPAGAARRRAALAEKRARAERRRQMDAESVLAGTARRSIVPATPDYRVFSLAEKCFEKKEEWGPRAR